MLTFAIVVVAAAAAAALGVVVARRRPDPPTSPRFAVPQQLDRSDFDRPDQPWLLAVFSSETCLSCRDAWQVVASATSPSLAVQRLDLATSPDVHRRYAIDAVPTIVLADHEGVVRWSYLGVPPPAAISETLVGFDIIPGDNGTAVNIRG